MKKKTLRVPALATLFVSAMCVSGCPSAPPSSAPAPPEDPSPAAVPLAAGAPRLVLFLVVDQARADYLERFRPLLRHGLGRLLEESVVFTDAHHDHAATNTSPGHATLATGRHPSGHGIISNSWYDRELRDEVYSVEDGDEDPTSERLLAPTLGDWLKAASPGSKVFAAGGKDRAAILTAGRQADAAFWFDTDDGDFESFSNRGEEERPWLGEFHRNRHCDRFFGDLWELLPEVAAHGAGYGIEPLDEGMFQTGFPRPLGRAGLGPGEPFYESVYRSPFLDLYVGDFARALIEGEGLGRDDVTDFLGVSFSAVDTVGHGFGPDSPELLDTLLRLDRVLGELIDFVDARVGLEHVIVSLSSDHGVTPVPEVMARRGQAARRFDGADTACVQRAGRRLAEELGDEDWILFGSYLDRDLARQKGMELRELTEAIRRQVEACPGVVRVWTREDLAAAPAGDRLARLYRHNLHPERSPDLFLQLEPHSLTSSTRASHGTPYPYDTWVPWLLRLPRRPGLEVRERVYTVDVAPTLAALIGLETPAELDGSDRGPLFLP